MQDLTFPDLIFVSLEDWDEVWRRNQFLCAGLARRFPQTRILFVGRPRDISGALRRGRQPSRRAAEETVPGLPNITLTQPLKLLPNSLAAGRRVNEALFRAHVRGAARRLGLRRPLLWLNPHSAVHMAGRMGERAVVYDITDDWTLAPSFAERERRLIAVQDRALCARADLVVVCSEALAESRRGLSHLLLLLPNGVDPAHYRQADCPPAPGQVPEWSGPVFGYTGTLHPDRIDDALIAAVAGAFPDGSVVLVGPDYLTPDVRARLDRLPNVHRVGPVSYADIPAYMSRFDVCLVPHGETAFTESLNPIKLWEYLACGKPIVSSNVAGFRQFGHLCRIASGPEAFAAACREALAEGDAGKAARRAAVAPHSWDARLDRLLASLDHIGANA